MLTFPVFAVGNMQDLAYATFVASSSVRRTDFQFLRSNLVLHSQSEPVGRQYPYISICSCPIFSQTLYLESHSLRPLPPIPLLTITHFQRHLFPEWLPLQSNQHQSRFQVFQIT